MKTTLLISALAVSFTGCAIDSIETDTNDTEIPTDDPDASRPEKLSANALSPADLAGVSIPVGALTQAYADSLTTTKAGRESLVYLVNCALAAGNSISSQHSCNPVTGVCQTIVYQGSIGLMTNWKTAVPTQDQQRQLSSCVLARMNEYSRTVTVSLRGTAYTTDAGELASYVYPEGGFFGNVFSGADNYWGSCDSAGPTHVWRQCAQSGHCSSNWVGDCATACTLDANGDFATCTGANGTTYSQPTTVYLNAI